VAGAQVPYPDPEPEAAYSIAPAHGQSNNGRIPVHHLAPIYQGRLRAGGPSAGWNTLNLYRASIGLGRIGTNGADSSYRPYSRQVFWRNWWCNQGNCGNAAFPGTSNHGLGKAVDSNGAWWIKRYGRHFGWGCSDAPHESWHVIYCGGFTRPNSGTNTTYPILRRGSGGPGQGVYVRRLERRLRFRHPNAEYRRNTAQAVRRAERRCGFKRPDGVTTRSTWLCVRRTRAARATVPEPYARKLAAFYERYRITRAPRTWKGRVKDAKGLLGYLARYQVWSRGTNATFARRLKHPTYRMSRAAIERGLQQRAARRAVKVISDRGVRFIAEFEGYYPNWYRDPVGVWTLGYGHTSERLPTWARPPLSRATALRLLRHDLRDYVRCLLASAKVRLAQGQFDALVSFTYNVGCGALRASTLLRRLNAGAYSSAAREFARWTKAGGRDLPGLVRRRQAEAAMFRGAR
jgi:lysozyme